MLARIQPDSQELSLCFDAESGLIGDLPMGGLVYLVAAFDPEAPFAGLHEIAPRALPAAERDAAFFQPLDFWQSRFRD